MPLPSQSVAHWIYGDHSVLPELRDRQTYLAQIAPRRVQHLRKRVQEHKPKAVIFYSHNYQTWWEQIAGARFDDAGSSGVQMIKTSDTLFVMTKHPTYRGVTTEYFVKAGAAIADARRSMV